MSTSFVKTDTILDKILTHKLVEIEESKRRVPQSVLEQRIRDDSYSSRDFAAALRKENVALIAEVKHASPSKGILIENFDPVALGMQYAENGASAISVLTDQEFFKGSLEYLQQVRQAVNIPCLRKEFIVDPYQIYEARQAGADAILLIVAALTDEQLRDLYALATSLGLAALIEVHHENELERALKIAPEIVGINNRDLKTFHVDLATTAKLANLVPEEVILVAESGIKSGKDVALMGSYGASAVLVGESLVKSGNLAQTVQGYANQKREK